MAQALAHASFFIVLAVASGLRLIKLPGDGVMFIEVDDLTPFHLEELRELLGHAQAEGFTTPTDGVLIEEAWLFDDGFGDRIVLVGADA
jgi:hypothetical protein